MKFNEYPYQRPNIEQLIKEYRLLIEEMKQAKTVEEQISKINEINELRDNFQTLAELVGIRASIDTTDEFYEQERDFFDENRPLFQAVEQEFSLAIINSKFKDALMKTYGKTIFDQIEVSLKTFNEQIIPLLQTENKLCSEYSKLIASAKIEFDGKINNLSQMTPYIQAKDRKIRKNANDLVAKFLSDNQAQFDEIYDQLVKVRNQMAIELGFKNYIALGYARLGRVDYDETMVANYRKQICNDLLPFVKEIIAEQGKRLVIPDMKNYDLTFYFNSGNPLPIGNRDVLVKAASQMYHEMSKETGEFFDFMEEHELMDLDSKKGKDSGGYCTFIPKYSSPFIFANFNGTSGDVGVLTHEAGHAFQVFSSRNVSLPEYRWPTLEACEIHSMSMEFFAHPWMEKFFGKDYLKYLYFHVCDSITFIPYGALVDEFQHIVYENPTMTKAERRKAWRTCELKYQPYKIYDNEVYEDGTWWYRQGHIFSSPFYYIDYTLAQVCAHQFFIKNMKDHDSTWQDYYHLCCLGGSKSFLTLLKEANLKNPFIDGTIKEVVIDLKKWLDNFDKDNIE